MSSPRQPGKFPSVGEKGACHAHASHASLVVVAARVSLVEVRCRAFGVASVHERAVVARRPSGRRYKAGAQTPRLGRLCPCLGHPAAHIPPRCRQDRGLDLVCRLNGVAIQRGRQLSRRLPDSGAAPVGSACRVGCLGEGNEPSPAHPLRRLLALPRGPVVLTAMRLLPVGLGLPASLPARSPGRESVRCVCFFLTVVQCCSLRRGHQQRPAPRVYLPAFYLVPLPVPRGLHVGASLEGRVLVLGVQRGGILRFSPAGQAAQSNCGRFTCPLWAVLPAGNAVLPCGWRRSRTAVSRSLSERISARMRGACAYDSDTSGHPQPSEVGMFPSTDHRGQPVDEVRQANAGKPLAAHGALCAMRGDWAELVSLLGFKSWSSKTPCPMCAAGQHNLHEVETGNLVCAPPSWGSWNHGDMMRELESRLVRIRLRDSSGCRLSLARLWPPVQRTARLPSAACSAHAAGFPPRTRSQVFRRLRSGWVWGREIGWGPSPA